MRSARFAVIAAGVVAGALTISSAAAQSGTAGGQSAAWEPLDQIRTVNGIRYACAGIGLDSREDPRWNQFPAKLVYSQRDGGYLVNVNTRITDASSGELVFERQCDGPWLLVDLPPGDYQVTAAAQDSAGSVHERQFRISVGGGKQTARTINFHEIQS